MSKAPKESSTEPDPKEAERKAELERAIRHRVGCEEKAFRIVERLLDNPIEEDFLMDCAKFITPSHYADVTQERAIVRQCGYPICENPLTDTPKQKYHINMKTNKVYDITDRKNFCSPFCYKASKYYGAQLSESPVWTREKDRPPDVQLLARDSQTIDAKTSSLVSQDEITFGKKVKESDIESQDTEEGEEVEKETMEMVSDDLSTLTFGESVKKERLEQLAKIAASVDSQMSTKLGPVSRGSNDSGDARKSDQCGSKLKDGEIGNQGDGKDQRSEIKVEEASVKVVNKQTENQPETAQVSTKVSTSAALKQTNKTAAEIASLSTTNKVGTMSASPVKQKKVKSKSKPVKRVDLILPLQLIETTLFEWRTDNTLKFLIGEDYQVDSSQTPAQDSKEASVVPEQVPARLEAGGEVKKGEELDSDDDSDEEPPGPASKPVPDLEKLREDTEEFASKVEEFYFGKPVEVKGNQQKGTTPNAKVKEDDRDRGIILPPVDSKSQMAIRRKITMDRLNRVLPDILLPMQLSFRNISSDLRQLLKTFHLSSHNITFKPNIWILLGIVLLHMLAVRNSSIQASLQDDHHRQFLSTLLVSVGTSLEEISQLVTRLQMKEAC